MRTYLLCAAAVSVTSMAMALEWERTQVDTVAKPGDTVVLATYTFINSSREKVEIGGIRTDCGCTETVVSATTLPPGKSGTIQVVFTVGDRRGKQHKEIFVETSDAKEPVKLVLNVDLPESAKAPAK